jgi:hypothetical protein
MLGVPLDKRIRRTLAVTVGANLAVEVDDTASPYFAASLLAPQADNSLLDGSPRTSLSPWRLYWDARGPELHACDRVEVPGVTTYELISQPRAVNAGRRVVGHSCPVLPISKLYPRSAQLHELGKDDSLGTVECALYSERQESRGRGTYRGDFADAAPSAWEAIRTAPTKNLVLDFGDGEIHKIASATLASELPYISLDLKRAG